MAKQTGRQRNQLPHCYYEGYLEKRSFKDKKSRKLWVCLCGKTLFFFNDSKDAHYIEKLDLTDFISVVDDSTRDRNLDAARLNLRLKDEEVHLTAPSLEARELWKGFIYSVVELSVPSSLNLLPGQIHMLKDTVEKERDRVSPHPPPLAAAAASAASSSGLYLSMETDMPACYQKVSRVEAELILERQPALGNLLLRPGSDCNSFAVTTRQDLNGSVFKHYRVTRRHGDFFIEVDNAIPCATLHDVILFLVEKTGGVLTPFIMEDRYEESLTFVKSNEENGEKMLQFALPPPPPLQSVPHKAAAPTDDVDGEEIYLNYPLFPPKSEEKEVQSVCPPSKSRLPAVTPIFPESTSTNDSGRSPAAEKKALMPPLRLPVPAPRKFPPSSSPFSSADLQQGRMRRCTLTSLPPTSQAHTISAISEELKQKLEKRSLLQ